MLSTVATIMANFAKILGVITCILCLCVLYSVVVTMESYNYNKALATGVNNTNFTNNTSNATGTKAIGPPQVMESKPTGNYTNGTALVTEGPRQTIQSQPTGNYTNGTALVTEGPRQTIQSQPTGN